MKLIATTYEYCEHEGFCYEMNDYPLNADGDIMEQLYNIAKFDYAPLVEVIELTEDGYKDVAELYYEEFKCNCEG